MTSQDTHNQLSEKEKQTLLSAGLFKGNDGCWYHAHCSIRGSTYVDKHQKREDAEQNNDDTRQPSSPRKAYAQLPARLRQQADGKSSTDRPAIFDMTDEELAATGNYDFGQQEPNDRREDNQPPGDNEDTKPQSQHLKHLLERERLLSEAATQPVVFSPALISRGDTGVIGRGTINIIQGAYGSHKSRLAELIAALMLTNNADDPQFLEFKRVMLERFCVCYIDTERPQKEDLPFAIQGIKLRAGFGIADRPENFRFTSIKAVDRKYRFPAIDAFIKHVRQNTRLHLFCVMDVVTDAVVDFNDAKESMKLYDFIGNLCDEQDATFLLVIHQNPGTEKARGHTGTEAANKANTALQIGFEKDARGNDTDLIRLRYLKLRRGKRPDPVYLQYDKEPNRLVLADAASVAAQVNHRRHKADTEDIADRLISLLADGPMLKGEVFKLLESEFGAGNATIRERLKSIKDEQPPMCDEQGRAVRFDEFRKGRDQFYQLAPIE